MITSAAELRKALRKGTWCGVVLYEGPSMLDGQPVVVIANRITQASANGKTGAMVQTFVIRSDVGPVEALKRGLDASVCGDCMHRPIKGGTCYVNVGRSVRSVYEAFTKGRYARPGVDFDRALIPHLFTGLAFRCGTYGDPTAAPFQVWRAATLRVRAITGYTHQWRQARFASFKAICMASADSEEEMHQAHAMGWRTFRVRHALDHVTKAESICPASAEAGHRTSCDRCIACGGDSSKTKRSMVIIAHGATAKRFNRLQERAAA